MAKVKNQNIVIQKNKGNVMKKPNKNFRDKNNANAKQSAVMKSGKFGGIKKNFAEKSNFKKINKPDLKNLIKGAGNDASDNPLLAKRQKKPFPSKGANNVNNEKMKKNTSPNKNGPIQKPFAKKEFSPKQSSPNQKGPKQNDSNQTGPKQTGPKQKGPKQKGPKQGGLKHDASKPNELVKTNGAEPKKEDSSKPKKERKPMKDKSVPLINAPKFDEAKFNGIVNSNKIQKIVQGLQTKFKTEVDKMKTKKIFDDYNYILNVTCFKIPNCPKRMVKFLLKHPMVAEDNDVCLITKDLHRGLRVDYEPTKQHYEDLLKQKGVTRSITVMPFNQIKKEYSTYELKGKLANSYDAFLCDATIVGHVVGFLGKKFQKSRSTPYAIRMTSADLNGEINRILQKTSYYQGQKGPMVGIPVATNKMSVEEITENIESVVSFLRNAYPGGLENIRNMYLRVNVGGTSALPLYISMCKPPDHIPNVTGIRQEKMTKLKEKANKILTKFELTNSGNVLPNKNNTTLKRPHQDEDINADNETSNKKKVMKVETVKKAPKEVKKEGKSKPVNSKEKPKNLIKLKDMSDSDSEDEEYKVCQSDTASEQLIEDPSDDEQQSSGPRPLILRPQAENDDDEEDNDDDDDDGNTDDDDDDIDAIDNDDDDDDSDAGSELEFEADSDEVIENGVNSDSDDDNDQDEKDEDDNEDDGSDQESD